MNVSFTKNLSKTANVTVRVKCYSTTHHLFKFIIYCFIDVIQLTPTFTGTSTEFFSWRIPYSGGKFFPCRFIRRYVIGKFVTAIFVFLLITTCHFAPHKATLTDIKTKTTQKKQQLSVCTFAVQRYGYIQNRLKPKLYRIARRPHTWYPVKLVHYAEFARI